MPVQKICECCRKEFSVPQRRHESVKFCSLECKTKAGRKTFRCVSCGSVFDRPKSDNPDAPHKYCSVDCYNANRKGVAHIPKPDAVRYYRNCEVCGVSFRVTKTRKDTARFCSRACQKNSPTFRTECSELQQEEKSWRWAGGKYQHSSGYVRTKKKVLSNEQVTLVHRAIVLELMTKQDPGHPFLIEVDGVLKLRKEIEVHHIDRIRSNNEPSNLLAVTKDAHAQIHHRNRKPKPWECWPRDPEKW